MMHHWLPKEERERLAKRIDDLLNQGLNFEKIGRRLGMSDTRVAAIYYKAGYPKRFPRKASKKKNKL